MNGVKERVERKTVASIVTPLSEGDREDCRQGPDALSLVNKVFKGKRLLIFARRAVSFITDIFTKRGKG